MPRLPDSRSSREDWLYAAALGASALAVLLGVGLLLRSSQQQQQQQQQPSAATSSPTTTTTTTTAPSAHHDEPTNAKVEPTAAAAAVAAKKASAKEAELGTAAFKAHQYASAVEHFSRALDLARGAAATATATTTTGGGGGNAEDAEAARETRKILLHNRAAAREKMGDLRGVVEDTRAALKEDPVYRRALVREARTLEALARYDEALEDLAMLSVLDGIQNQQTRNGSNNDSSMMAGQQPSEESQAINAALERIMQLEGQREADALWPERMRLRRNAPRVLPPVGFCRAYYYTFCRDARLMRQPTSQLALRDAQERASAAGLKGDALGEALFELGTMHKSRLELNEANDAFTRAATLLSSKSKRAKCLLEIGTMMQLAGDALSAKEEFLRAAKLDESDPIALVKLAGVALDDGDFTEGGRVFDRALALADDATLASLTKDDRADVYFHASQLSLLLLDLTTSRLRLKRAVELVPDFGMAHMQLGVVEFRLQEIDESLSQLELACRVIPELAEVHNYFGEVLMSVGRMDEAVEKFHDATNADDKCALPILNQGVMFMQGGAAAGAGDASPSAQDLKDALALFDAATQIDPTCEVAYVHRASFHFHVADFERAIQDYDRAIDLARTKMDLAEYAGLRAVARAQAKAHGSLVRQGLLERRPSFEEAVGGDRS